MARLSVFNQISLDGNICDVNGDMSWAHRDDPEWNQFTAQNAGSGGQLVLGRITYDLMAGFWPTAHAVEQIPQVAEKMNSMPKLVFSRKMREAAWNNTRVFNGDIAGEIRRMKQDSGPDMTILGSGSIVSQLAQRDLIDEYQIVVVPTVLGSGKTMFAGIKERINLKLINVRTFTNGNLLLLYTPNSRPHSE
ncbi:MAG: hypothetical protein A2Z16_07000 [Chloroflexi bacterium RBG_16_54_18]|nr:MAG: hypothetical protein A2Z16_07000 [Chloroflexi bacterium RBG_16_54_18]